MGEQRGKDEKEGPQPGEGEGLEEASKEAVRELERREGHAGSGDIG